MKNFVKINETKTGKQNRKQGIQRRFYKMVRDYITKVLAFIYLTTINAPFNIYEITTPILTTTNNNNNNNNTHYFTSCVSRILLSIPANFRHHQIVWIAQSPLSLSLSLSLSRHTSVPSITLGRSSYKSLLVGQQCWVHWRTSLQWFV